MPRVKCPHCGAGNQDATEEDTCWQCGNVLGAPVMRVATPPSSGPLSAPTQQLDPTLAKNLPNKYPPQNRPAPTGSSSRMLTVALVVAVLVIAALMILVFVMLSR
jgi:hypothetical protein